MKSKILLSLLILFAFSGLAQTSQCITLRGKSGTGMYRQWGLASYGPSTSDTSGTEIIAAGWTCNAQGIPVCDFRSLIWYNVSAVPTNATIVSARLYLYANKTAINGVQGQPTYGSSNAALLQRVIAPWDPMVGWNNIPATTTAEQKLLPQSTNTAQDYVVDLKDFVQQWVSNPATNHGMLFKLVNEVDYNSMIFYSGKASESLQPKLEICYTTPAPPVYCANAVVIRGDRMSGRFKQAQFASYAPNDADTSQTEINASAWTCNAIGYPICNFRSILRYDVRQVPVGATITSATLYLYANKQSTNGYAPSGQPTYGGNNAGVLQKVIAPWSTPGIGWANQPAVTTAGQRILPQSTSPAQNYAVDLKDMVQYWVNYPDSNYGALLRLQTEDYYNSLIFHSGQSVDSLKPRLEICYTMNQPDRCEISLRDSIGGNSLIHQFTATPGASNTRKPVKLCWKFGDGKDTCVNYDPKNPFNYYGISHTYSQAGKYQVQLIANFEGNCNDTAILQIEVKAPPSQPTCDKQLVIRGGSAGNKFKVLQFASYAPYSADTSGAEIVSAAWTCNAQGFPICNFRTILRYDVSSLPANAIITGAKLYLYAKTNNINGYLGSPTFGSNNASLLQRVTSPWSSVGTGWNNQPAVTTSAQKLLPQSTSNAQNYVLDVKDFVQHWVNKPDSNYGVLLRMQTEGYYNSMVFVSTQGVETLRPTLEICYTVPNTGTDSCRTNITDSIIGDNSLNRKFTASAWNSNNKKPIRVCWSFGDGKDTCLNYSPASNLPAYSFNHSYAQPGTYNVCVKVQFDGGCTASACRKITVLGAPNQPCMTTIVLKGDRTSKRFRELQFASYAPYDADTSQTEIVAAAWTCYAMGYPICNFRSILRYDVSMVPANAIINNAKLTLYAKTNNINGYAGSPTYGSNNTALLQKVIAPWAMPGTGWANQPATTADKQKILPQSGSQRQNYIVDVTDFVKDWVKTPAANYGMMLKLASEDYYNSMVFHSGLSADSVRPRLEICYSLPAADTNLVEMKLYPNPTTGPLQAWINCNRDETGDAKLYDMQGNLKQVITNNIRCHAGITLLPIQVNRGGIPSGHYYVKIRVGNATRTFKIFLL